MTTGTLAAIESSDTAVFLAEVFIAAEIWKVDLPGRGTHDPIFLTAGDDWIINTLLTDATGQPLPISDPSQVQWTLLDASHMAALPATDFSIEIGPGGAVMIAVAAASSTTLIGGSYHDVYRVKLSGAAQTVLQGAVLVQADPFGAATVPAERAARIRSKVAAVRTAQWAGELNGG
jgi:hypothetical protein